MTILGRFLILALLSSCGDDPKQTQIYEDSGIQKTGELSPQDLETESVELTWRPVSEFSESTNLDPKALVYISKPGELVEYCTGTVVGKNWILTSYFCIGDDDQALGAQFVLDHGGSKETYLQCDYIQTKSFMLNYSLIYCEDLDYISVEAPVLKKWTNESLEGKNLGLYQYNCDFLSSPKCAPSLHLSEGEILDTEVYLRYSNSSLPRSTGAPLFHQQSGDLLGIHVNSILIEASSSSIYNEGVSLGRILNHIEEKAPSVFQDLSVSDI
jgi:V8-like Glu-specific endopeptidase